MSLVSEYFLLFSAALVLCYFIVPKKLQWVCLLIFSGVFYCFGGLSNVIYILITAVSAYICGLVISRIQQGTKAYISANKSVLSKEERGLYKKKRNNLCKAAMVLTLLLNIGILCVFKYSDFVLRQVCAVLPSAGVPSSLGLIIPLGISFYTFQTIGYVVDVYWEKAEAQKNFAKLLLFVSFFPQVTQGPISDYNQLSSQLFTPHSFVYKNFSYGIQRMMWGFFKKMVIADRAAPMVHTAFSEYTAMNGNNVLLGAFLYSLQIYADFSGYMDIVCGLCEILDIKLAENFDRPYFSKSIAEYWRRWHITLGAWFKTYIYYPIAVSNFAKKCAKSGKKTFGKTFGKTVAASIALVAVWLTTGLWHGASWAYIAWGGLNGLFIIFSLWMEPVYAKMKTALHVKEDCFAWRTFVTLRTFFLVTLIKVFPEVGGFSDGAGFWKHCFINWKLTPLDLKALIYPITTNADLVILVLGAVLMFTVSLMQRKQGVRDRMVAWPSFTKYIIFAVMFFAIVYYGIPTQNMGGGFMYAQF